MNLRGAGSVVFETSFIYSKIRTVLNVHTLAMLEHACCIQSPSHALVHILILKLLGPFLIHQL